MDTDEIFKSSIKVIVIFCIVYCFILFQYLSKYLVNLKKNFTQYRCNPLVMPMVGLLGHNAEQNFSYCIQNIQSNFMHNFTEPLYYLGNGFSSMIGDITGDIQFIRKKIFSVVSNIINVVQSIFGVFLNILIAFQHNAIKTKDLLSKMVGTLVGVTYILEGVYLSGMSVWNGPVGKTLRTACFHPTTQIKLFDGKMKQMKDIQVYDILENGSIVEGTLILRGNIHDKSNPFYKIYSEERNEWVYVTGSHLVKSKDSGFIPVETYELSVLEDSIESEYLSCLITHDHLIPFGEHTFWDWED